MVPQPEHVRQHQRQPDRHCQIELRLPIAATDLRYEQRRQRHKIDEGEGRVFRHHRQTGHQREGRPPVGRTRDRQVEEQRHPRPQHHQQVVVVVGNNVEIDDAGQVERQQRHPGQRGAAAQAPRQQPDAQHADGDGDEVPAIPVNVQRQPRQPDRRMHRRTDQPRIFR